MSDVLAGRAQMGTSLGFHIVFACLGVGLPVLIAMAHFAGLKRQDAVWMRVAERLTRAFTVLIVIGVISGLIISIELSILWPRFMEVAGPIIGTPISLETYAFFFEAIFLSLYLFGRDRLSPWLHWATLIPVCIGGAVSTWIIVSVNAWMNAPVGFDYVNGEFRNPDIIAAIFNPAMPGQTIHMLSAAYMASGFAVAAVYAFSILRGRRGTYERRGLALGMTLVAFWTVPMGVSGDLAGRLLHENQPLKLAAVEGLVETERGAALTIGGIVNEEGGVDYGIEIPYGLSLLVARDPNVVIKGLEEFPRDEWPNVPVVRYAFQFMVGVGFMLGLVMLAYWFARWRKPHWLGRDGGPPERPGKVLLGAIVAAGPLTFGVVEAGWIVTEVGRQPWIIYGYKRVSESLTDSPLVGLMFVIFTVLYVILTVVTIVALRSELALLPASARHAHGPGADAHGERDLAAAH